MQGEKSQLTWYFVNTKNDKVRAILSAESYDEIAKLMGYPLKKLKIWEAN